MVGLSFLNFCSLYSAYNKYVQYKGLFIIIMETKSIFHEGGDLKNDNIVLKNILSKATIALKRLVKPSSFTSSKEEKISKYLQLASTDDDPFDKELFTVLVSEVSCKYQDLSQKCADLEFKQKNLENHLVMIKVSK